MNLIEMQSLSDENVQTNMSIFLANLLSDKELYDICDDMLMRNLINKKRDISIENETIYKYTNYNLEIELIDTLDIMSYPAIRFVELDINCIQLMEHYKNRFKYFTNIYNIINRMFTNAYNFSAYCKDDCKLYKINKILLYNKFTELIDDLMKSDYKDYIHYIGFQKTSLALLNYNELSTENRFIKLLDLTPSVQGELIAISDILLKFSVYDKKGTHKYTIYLDRGIKGKGHLELILDLLLKMNYTP